MFALRSRLRRILPVVSVVLAGPLLAPATAASSAPEVTLQARGATSIAQGLPFRFRARVTNTTGGELHLDVTFEVHEVSTGASIRIRRWHMDLAAGEIAVTSVGVVSAQWFPDLGPFEVVPTIDGQPAGDALAFEVTRATVTVPTFVDITAQSGLRTVLGPPRCGQWASGAAWGDGDGDGDLDLYVPNRSGSSQLWINDGSGHFTEQAAARGIDDPGAGAVGAVFADYDNDGDQDLFVVNTAAPNRLYRNDGAGTFTDVAATAGVAGHGAGPSATWGDYDQDGFLDLYVVNHETCQGGYQPDQLFHNEGDGTFTDQTALLGPVGQTLGAGYQAAWFDYDNDGDPDLYLANDFLGIGPDENHLWRNDGAGPGGTWLFTDVSVASGTDYAINSMGIGIADYDHDMDYDFAVSNIGPTLLARNNGDGTFTEVAKAAGVARPFQNAHQQSVTWGLDFADLNLDGWEDLFVAAGPIGDVVGQPNEVFVNVGGGRFADLSAPSGATGQGLNRGVGFADFDRDGRVDLYVVNMGGFSRLYRNITPSAGMHWLEVRATGTASNRDGCGARLRLTAGGLTLLRDVFCGSTSFASSNDHVVHFGLGSASTVDSLVIQWPSGITQTLGSMAGDQLVEVTEP